MEDMIKPHRVLHVVLVFVIYCSFVRPGQQPTCHSNGCDGCCSSSDRCTTEHTFIRETGECLHHFPRPSPITPLVPGLELCPFDLHTVTYGSCPNSYVNDQTNSVGDYGKPNWVGAEFQSQNFEAFSMTVMWEHADSEILSTLPTIQGYEIRIMYKRAAGRSEGVVHCFCVTDSSMRNVSDIRSSSFTYHEMANMIVEVRAFPSLTGQDERNRRRNCSLLTGCSTTEECSDDCYSWPQSCLNLTPYSPESCVPPIYSPPVNIRALSDNGKLDLSWEPPRMNYKLFPVPNMYYITIESTKNDTFQFKAANTTRITLSSLNLTSAYYTVFITAYVPCSGLSPIYVYYQDTSLAGWCGYFAHIEYSPSCDVPTPPLHGWLSDYHSISLHSAVTFQCDFGWSPSEQFITTCSMSTKFDRLEWVPDAENHTCSGMQNTY